MAYLVAARHGAMHNIANFVSGTGELKIHDHVVLRTDRGSEMGEVISAPEYIMRGTDVSDLGEVIRKATRADEERMKEIENVLVPQEIESCRELIRSTRIPMKLATVEHLLGGEKIIFYFLADGRVDFRQLVKDLAGQYHTRIEMRQIGVRDEARLLAEIEHCGQPLCCKTFMHDLAPVSMRMAKCQKTTLDPAKISGRCGRLMCCLRFEDETYVDYKNSLPRKGDIIVSERGTGRVLTQEILARTLLVEMEDGIELKLHLNEIQQVLPAKREQQSKKNKECKQCAQTQNGNCSNHDRKPQRETKPRNDDAGASVTAPDENAAADGGVDINDDAEDTAHSDNSEESKE